MREHAWEISNEFWAPVEPLIPTQEESRGNGGTRRRSSQPARIDAIASTSATTSGT